MKRLALIALAACGSSAHRAPPDASPPLPPPAPRATAMLWDEGDVVWLAVATRPMSCVEWVRAMDLPRDSWHLLARLAPALLPDGTIDRWRIADAHDEEGEYYPQGRATIDGAKVTLALDPRDLAQLSRYPLDRPLDVVRCDDPEERAPIAPAAIIVAGHPFALRGAAIRDDRGTRTVMLTSGVASCLDFVPVFDEVTLQLEHHEADPAPDHAQLFGPWIATRDGPSAGLSKLHVVDRGAHHLELSGTASVHGYPLALAGTIDAVVCKDAP